MVLTLTAQNPVIHDQFSADPTARVFGDRVYLYPSHDIPAPADARQNWFCMADYHVFSSEDLTEWTDHGVIITQNDVPWVRTNSYAMWAPDCVCRDGRYYFYFPAAPRNGQGFAIGVATADSPEGPFMCEPEPIAGVTGIDPCVLLDDDGQAYIYWSGMGIRGARLKDNLLELADPLQEIAIPRREGQPEMPPMRIGGEEMKGLPEGFKEGPFVFRRGDWYYLTFPWVRQEGGTETLAYAMSASPLGPWDFKGVIMQEHANSCWTNHHSIVEYKGQWYIFYHHNDFSPHFDKQRSVRIERLTFNPDGTIPEVTPTLRGVGINRATARIDVDRYSASSPDVTTDYVDSLHPFRGWQATMPSKSWLRYDDVDFSEIQSHSKTDQSNAYLTARVKAEGYTTSTLVIREKSSKGKVIARVEVRVDSLQYRDRRPGQWFTVVSQPPSRVPQGITDLYITCEGAPLSIDWLQFKNHANTLTPVPDDAAPAHPDEEGFVRRWLLLEPIMKSIRTNTLFVDSYLNETLAPASYVEGVPVDGQTVKVDGKKLRWHAVDSKQPNVKLFHYGLSLGVAYGVLFWAVTVIDCPEDLTDVRLSVGSNSASRWWIDGEEVLMLSGDRRMVKDDAVSPRLTLSRGRHVVRGAVINGPGMSDTCVRFLGEDGKPITNFNISLSK